MQRAFLGLVLGWLLAGAVQAATPSVRVAVEPLKAPLLVGQQIAIDVTVVAPNFFTSAPPFPALEVPGAIVTMPDERATLGVETVAGETFATVQKRYLFTAQQAGDFILPPAKIAFTYGGDDGKPQTASLTLPPTRLSARLPAGAAQAGAGSVLPVARLTIQQRWDRDTKDLRAGDALVRTVEIVAARTQAMMIPPPHFEAPDGVRVFVADPVLDDASKDRADFLGGHRTDRVTYVFERAGHFTLPAVEVRWFDPATQKPASAQAPALSVTVAAGAHRGEAIAPEAALVSDAPASRRPWWAWAGWAWALVLLALAAGGAWVLRMHGPRWRAQWQARWQARAASEPVMFRQLLAACAQGDARAAHAGLLAWCGHHARMAPRAWAASIEDAELAARIDALERHLYAAGADTPAGWQGASLAAALRAAHGPWRVREAAGPQRPGRAHALGPLNPFDLLGNRNA